MLTVARGSRRCAVNLSRRLASSDSKKHVDEVLSMLENNAVEGPSSNAASASGKPRSNQPSPLAGGRRRAAQVTNAERQAADDSVESWRVGGSLQDKMRIKGVTFKSDQQQGAVFGDSATGSSARGQERGRMNERRSYQNDESADDEFQLQSNEPLTPAHFRDSNTQLDSFRSAHTQLGHTQPESMSAEPLEDKAVALVQAINDPEVSLQTLMSQAQGLTLEQLQTALKFHENVKSGAVQTLNARNASRLAREQEKVQLFNKDAPLPPRSPFHLPYKLRSPRDRAALVRAQSALLQVQHGPAGLEAKLQELAGAPAGDHAKASDELTTDEKLGRRVRLAREGKLIATEANKQELGRSEEFVEDLIETEESNDSREKVASDAANQRHRLKPLSVMFGNRDMYFEDATTNHPFEPFVAPLDTMMEEDMEYEEEYSIELEDVVHELYNDPRINPELPAELIKRQSKKGEAFKKQLNEWKQKLGYAVTVEQEDKAETERKQKLAEWQAARSQLQQKFYAEFDALQAATYAGTARDPFAPSMSLEQIAEHSPARQMSNLAVAEAQQQKLARDRLKAATEALRQRRGRMFALSQSLSAATADAHMAAVQQSVEGQTEQEKQASEVKEEQGADSKLEIEKMQVECDQLEALVSHLTEIVRGSDDVEDAAVAEAEEAEDSDGVFGIPREALESGMEQKPVAYMDNAPTEVPWLPTRPQAQNMLDIDLTPYMKESVAKFRYLPKTYLMEPDVCQITNGLTFENGAPKLSREAAAVAQDNSWRAPLLQEAKLIVNELPMWPNHKKEQFLKLYARAVYRPL